MLFDPTDPFPLVQLPYADAQAHAAAADRWLGLDTDGIEAALAATGKARKTPGQELWIGLPVQTLLTPYTELRGMLEHLAPARGSEIVDLGAGYGRLGFVIGRYFPEARFTGFEYVPERVEAGQAVLERFGWRNARLERADLALPSFRVPRADVYFIYDYGSREAIAKTLTELRELARGRAITVVGRGRATRDRIERAEPWLSQVLRPEHRGNWSVYRSA